MLIKYVVVVFRIFDFLFVFSYLLFTLHCLTHSIYFFLFFVSLSIQVQVLQTKWSSQKTFVSQLTDKAQWQMYRAVHDDESLKKSLLELEAVASEIASLGSSVEPMMIASLKATQIGWVLRHSKCSTLFYHFKLIAYTCTLAYSFSFLSLFFLFSFSFLLFFFLINLYGTTYMWYTTNSNK